MNQFAAEEFYRLGVLFKVLAIEGKRFSKQNPDYVFGASDVEELLRMLNEALDHAASISLSITTQLIVEALELAKEGELPRPLLAKVNTIMDVIEKEMKGQLFLYVPGTRAEWYEKDAARFMGQNCCDRFRSTLPEFEEAMKCYAVGRFTACVFHLMRASESGIVALGTAIGATMRNHNWGDVFKEYDRQLGMPLNSRPPHWQTHADFLEHIGADLRAIKPYRNETQHLDRSYTEEQAARLMAIMPDFIRRIAENMDETGKML